MKKIFLILVTSLLICSCSQTGEISNTKISSDSIKDTIPEAYKSITAFPDVENPNKPLILELNAIYQSDQDIRHKFEEIEKKYKQESKEFQAFGREWFKIDSVNTLKVIAILDKYGWLGADEIGSQGNTTLWLVIQHSDIKIQEKYLPMMRKALKDGKANPADLALLEDRILIRHGKKQIYGSQLEMDTITGKYKLAPIDDEPNVNKRRAEVGLEPLEEYAKNWAIKYVLPKK